MLIEQQKQFDALLYELNQVDLLAIDFEFIRRKSFFAKPALMQIAWDYDKFAVIDLLQIDLTKFIPIWQNHKICKIIHSAEQDVEIVYNLSTTYPKNLFDSQIAWQFINYEKSSSYQCLIEEFFGIRLDKTMQKNNWLERPLAASAIEYAKNDVIWLFKAHQKLKKILIAKKRWQWYKNELKLAQKNWKIRFDQYSYYQSVNQFYLMSIEYQKLFKKLCSLREALTREVDLPRNWVANDSLILRSLKIQPKNEEQFSLVKKNDYCHKKFSQLVIDFFQKKSNQINHSYKLKKILISAKEKEKINDLKQQIINQAKLDNINPNLALRVQDLKFLIKNNPKSLYLSGWRKDWLCNADIKTD